VNNERLTDSNAQPTPTAKVVIHLEIEGSAADAYYVIDGILDAGFLQDAINEHDADCGVLHVRSAVVRHDGAC
jgi:hypothetical protein